MTNATLLIEALQAKLNELVPGTWEAHGKKVYTHYWEDVTPPDEETFVSRYSTEEQAEWAAATHNGYRELLEVAREMELKGSTSCWARRAIIAMLTPMAVAFNIPPEAYND